jgi:membrane-associated phospholipid phosphatase
VHYPLDILGGMVLGMGVALIVYAILRGFQTKLKAGIKSQLIDS